jgi:hypothetical protein
MRVESWGDVSFAAPRAAARRRWAAPGTYQIEGGYLLPFSRRLDGVVVFRLMLRNE